ncbi:hypothetical protein DQ384_03550 [Sphaerisporangium album]|uniref:DUF4097 domain-containing protein n=1 Tax=Sphaerisporangium album TaxID=509200 RepID=A0A367FSB1_9ACTN|nr:DUF4097 family beta strand repeat-containing protein [Sphaerisporangium album]RCG32580.1 hypothetical protein DQ384_03550 [Sphaerisporangium album]
MTKTLSSGPAGSPRPSVNAPARGSRRRAPYVLAAGAVLGAGLLLTGCGLGNIAGPTKQAEQAYDVTGDVGVLRVDSDSGAIVVTESRRSGVHVTETLHWKSTKPATSHPVSGGTLRLEHKCEGDWGCDVDYKIEIPRGLDVRLETGSGDITLRSLTGELQARTGSGVIDARDLGGGRAVAETGSGDVELRFATAPRNVEVDTGSGDGVVHVPQESYHVTLDTGSGSHTLELPNDAASPRRIIVRTGSGDAKVLKA